MTRRELRNAAASVHQRLLNIAKARSRPFDEILQYFAMERFLYRLAQSRHADAFVLKGALLFRVWNVPGSRAVPRHSEISDLLCRKICKDLGVDAP